MPQRVFGSPVTRVDLTKELFIPITSAGGGSSITNIGNYPAALLDALGEWCRVTVQLPETYTTVRTIGVMLISAQAGVNLMNFDISYDAAFSGGTQVYNTHTGANLLAQNNSTFDFLDYVRIDGLLAALFNHDMLAVTVGFRGAGGVPLGIATNAYILGLLVWWN